MNSKFFSVFLIFAIIFVVVFGFLGMSFLDHNGLFACPFSMLGVSDCSSATNALALASHHVSGLQSLTQLVFNSGTTLLALSFLSLMITFVIYFRLPKKNLNTVFYQDFQLIENSNFAPNGLFLKWLALHNKRDTHALERVHVLS